MDIKFNDDYHNSLLHDNQAIRFVDVKKWNGKCLVGIVKPKPENNELDVTAIE